MAVFFKAKVRQRSASYPHTQHFSDATKLIDRDSPIGGIMLYALLFSLKSSSGLAMFVVSSA
jgi:hypothetical protein